MEDGSSNDEQPLPFYRNLSFSSVVHGQATYTAECAARQQVAVSVGGGITRKITSKGLTYDPTSAGLAEGSYRFNFNHWLGVEANYYFQNSQEANWRLSSMRTTLP